MTDKNNPIQENEKQKLLDDLTKSANDLGVIAGTALRPLIVYIKNKYDTLPDDKQQSIQNLVNTIKKYKQQGSKKISDLITTIKKTINDSKKTEKQPPIKN